MQTSSKTASGRSRSGRSGAPWFAIALLALGVAAVDARADFERRIDIKPPEPHREAQFGFAVALSGDRLLVGAPQRSVKSTVRAGAAFLFDAGSGDLLATFENPQPVRDAGFGRALALHGDRALIGAPGQAIGDVKNAGAAYLFEASSGTLLATLTPASPRADGFYGRSVGFLGDAPVIGAVVGLDAEGAAGDALLRIDPATGSEQQRFLPPRPKRKSGFGLAFAALADTLLVGAPNTPFRKFPDVGVAYEIDAVSGTVRRTLMASARGVHGLFGQTLALSTERFAVSTPNDRPERKSNRGVVYLFSRADAEQVKALREPGFERPGRIFGTSLVFAADRLVASAITDFSLRAEQRQPSLVYVIDPERPESFQTLSDPEHRQDHLFGHALAADGKRLAIGAVRLIRPSTQGFVSIYTDESAPAPAPAAALEP